MKKLYSLSSLSGVLLVAASLSTPQTAMACVDGYLGQVCLIAGNYCPRGTFQAAGQALSISQYTTLYSLLGSMYGGDDRTYFNLPDLRGRAAVGYGAAPGLTTTFQGLPYGSEYVVQTVSQLPAHTHTATLSADGLVAKGSVELAVTGQAKIATSTEVTTSGTPANYSVLAAGAIGREDIAIYGAGTEADVVLGPSNSVEGEAEGSVAIPVEMTAGTVTVGVTGNQQAMPVVGPRLAMNYCIVYDGLYPPRP